MPDMLDRSLYQLIPIPAGWQILINEHQDAKKRPLRKKIFLLHQNAIKYENNLDKASMNIN